MRVKDYSSAVIALVKDGMSLDTALTSLRNMLTRRGHTRLYPKILRDLERVAEGLTKEGTVTVTVAHEDDLSVHKDAIERSIAELRGTTHVTRVDETITGGFIAEGKEKRIDQSYKKQLLTIYRSLIES